MSWKGNGKKRSWADLRDYPGDCLDGVITSQSFSHNSFPAGRDLNCGLLNRNMSGTHLAEALGSKKIM
jgi:hypothetical protein